MEVYILDDRLRRIAVIDRFESMIWTERYTSLGDFQLVIQSTVESRGLLVADTWLSVTASKRVMVIENVVNKDDSEGKSLLTVTGHSIESILMNRANRAWQDVEEPGAVMSRTGFPMAIARTIFNDFCVSNTVVPEDNIPFYVPGTIYPPTTIAEPEISYTIDFGLESVYDSIKNLADTFGFGFRLYTAIDKTELYFNVYTGTDRTAQQTSSPSVIFSNDLDNLTNISELLSKEKYKNVAYVYCTTGTAIAYADGASATTTGFDRKIILVQASDPDPEIPRGPELTAYLVQKGEAELANYRSMYAVDGEIPQRSVYKYEVDYFLGDLVEMRSESGLTNNMRVVEQIFVDDGEGERSYPTLSIDSLIVPGTWMAWDYNEVWDAVSDSETWDTA